MTKLLLLVSTLAVVICTSQITGHESGGLTFEVQDKERFCFYEQFRNASVYILDYQVLKGGNLDIDMDIKSPKGKTLYKEKRRQRDSIPLEVSVGTFTFCFGNEFSSMTHKVVHFNMRPSELDTRALAREVGAEKIKPGVQTMIEQMTEAIHFFATKIVHYQAIYRKNEAQGRYVAETLNFHVTWWSIAQAFIIMFTGFGQIFVLKRFFTDRHDRVPVPAPPLTNDVSYTGQLPMRP